MALVAAALWTLAPLLGHLALYLTEPGDIRWAQFSRVDAIALALRDHLAPAVCLPADGPARTPSSSWISRSSTWWSWRSAIGVLIHWAQSWFVPTDVEPMITWIGPIILITAGDRAGRILAKMLVAGLIAASMDSIGMIVAQATGRLPVRPVAQRCCSCTTPTTCMLGAAVVISARGDPARASR